tara:strand:+ start:18739 stop:19926 length:1188 start_codon:yes stop_codon:yes gene_type:complete
MQAKDITWEAELDLNLVQASFQKAIQSKKLFRYQFKNSESSVNILERVICKYVNNRFALGVSSATNAIFLALKASGAGANTKVLIPAFTFTAVPSAVLQCGAEPVLVDINEDYVIDLNDLEIKILSSGAKYLLLSHMRGHLCDMDKVVKICEKYSISLIEDAAHALGVTWGGKHAGTFGLAGIYSLQSYKIINAGEGGILTTNDPDIFWKSVFMSGSYENNFLLHSDKDLYIAEKYKNKLPVFNVRMSNIIASLAIPQVNNIESTIKRINKNYEQLEKVLSKNKLIQFPKSSSKIRAVRDSAQMRIKIDDGLRIKLKNSLNKKGIPISYFGGDNNTNARLYENWEFIDNKNFYLPNTKKNLSEVFDLRLPLHFTSETISTITKVFLSCLGNLENK